MKKIDQRILKEWQQAEDQQIQILKKRSATISTGRFFIFVAFLAGIVAAALTGHYLYWLPVLLALALFVALVNYHGKIKKNLLFHNRRSFFIDHYLKLTDGRFYEQAERSGQAGSGAEAAVGLMLKARQKEELAVDLDLVGDFSLAEFLGAGRSPDARLQMLIWLTEAGPAGVTAEGREEDRQKAAQKRREAVFQLINEPDFCLDCSAVLAGERRRFCERLTPAEAARTLNLHESATDRPAEFTRSKGWLSFISFALPLVTGAATLCFVFKLFLPLTGWLTAAGFVLQLLLFALTGQKTSRGKAYLANLRTGLTDLEELVALLKRTPAEAFSRPDGGSLLAELKALLIGAEAEVKSAQKNEPPSAAAALKQLSGLQKKMLLAANPALGLLLNGFLMWDFHLSAAIERWAEANSLFVDRWFGAAGALEALLALTTPFFTGRQVCRPEISDRPVQAVGLSHPLLSPAAAVSNDFNLEEGITLITGSNMSGKTTLMRTIGVNLCLAYAGAPVLADCFSMGPDIELFTSMRVGDDISAHTSTFYAEIKRIRAMIEASREGRHLVCLIDEIFKGTNSADRIAGAEATLRQLCVPGVAVLVTTHDMELCRLEEDPAIRAKNYHFEESYPDDVLTFDYRVKEGRSRTTNARYLLRLAGIELAD